MKYDIYLSDMSKKTVLRMPVLPEELPKISKASSNEVFETFNNGSFNIVGSEGLTEFTLESWFPGKGKNYLFQKVKNISPYAYIDHINRAMVAKKPLRVLIVRDDGTVYVNNTFSIESFEYNENKIGNFPYSIAFKQWRDYNV